MLHPGLRRSALAFLLVMLPAPMTLGAPPAATLGHGRLAEYVETEPNDTRETATPIGTGVTHGAVDPRNDVDYLVVQLPGNASVWLEMRDDFYDYFALLDASGNTVRTSYRDPGQPRPKTLFLNTTSAGTYYVMIRQYWPVQNPPTDPSPHRTYSLTIRALQPGPGDPTTTRVSGADAIGKLVAGDDGDLFVLDGFDGNVLRIRGSAAPVMIGGSSASDMALDGFGDLLLPQNSAVYGPCGACIVRLSPASGELTRFGTASASYFAVTIAPNGDVWAAHHDDEPGVTHFDPDGNVIAEHPTGGFYVGRMAFSPAGALHVTSEEFVYRMEADGGFVLVYTADAPMHGITFDAAGSMYLSTWDIGLLKVSSSYELVGAPFAMSNLIPSGSSAFLRSATGGMTSRLVASGPATQTDNGPRNALMVEVNPAGVTAPGLRIGTDFEPEFESALGWARVGDAYQAALAASIAGTWTLTAGTLPPGLDLASSGQLTGTPTATGHFDFTVTLTTSSGRAFDEPLAMWVLPTLDDAARHLLGDARFDGDLELALDAIGNSNGAYDLGDLRAYVQSDGTTQW